MLGFVLYLKLGRIRPDPALEIGKGGDLFGDPPLGGGGGKPCLFGPVFGCLGGGRAGRCGGLRCCC